MTPARANARTASSRKWTLQVNVLAASPIVRQALRARLWRAAGIRVGSNVDLRPHSWVFSAKLEVGDDSLVAFGCRIENREQVTLGSRVGVGSFASFVTSTHEKGGREQRHGAYAGEPIVVGDGCWIGSGATLLPGVVLGPGCIVGAGAVVLGGEYEADSLLVGVPARARPLEEPTGLVNPS
jgi:acetyltransferase-like isoleucine patch superfamily enzyme